MGKLIEKEGRFYKECGVVMLKNWKTKSCISITGNGTLYSPNNGEHNCYIHLYITSDDEIKEGDWKYCSASGTVLQANLDKENKTLTSCCKYCKKIIATTDSSLIGIDEHAPFKLPQPSEKFIQAFIETFNRGEKIEKVLVEYDRYFEGSSLGGAIIEYEYNLKLKDNNIIIKKIKTEYTREDMIHALTYGCREGKLGRTHSDILIEYKQNHL